MRMRSLVRIVAVATVLVATVPATAGTRPTPREGAAYAVPLFGTVVRPWDAPEDRPFAAGHRGIDVAATVGTPVRTSAAGMVSFSGSVAGNRTVSVDHADGVRTTYSFLGTIVVHRGDTVALGDVVGTVGTGHPDEGLTAHVHLSARRGELYFDPVELYVGTSYADLVALVA